MLELVLGHELNSIARRTELSEELVQQNGQLKTELSGCLSRLSLLNAQLSPPLTFDRQLFNSPCVNIRPSWRHMLCCTVDWSF